MRRTPHTLARPAAGLYVSPTDFVAFAAPASETPLSAHIATRDRSPDFSALGLYLPNPDPILKRQGKDSAVYADLRADAHVGGCIRRRKAGVLTMEWRIERVQASARMAKLCLSVLQRLDMRRVLREILDAPLFGWQPLEVIWSAPDAGGPIVPADVLAKPIHWFHYDAQAQLRFRSRNAPLLGEPVLARKFLVGAQDASYVNPYGFADLSMCFWPTVFKRGGLKFWVTFTEKYGTPWLVGKTPRATAPKEQEALLDQLAAMVQDAVAVIPDDASVQIVESGGKSASADLYERLLMFCRSEVAIALLGQNQTTEASANRASATAGLHVTDELRDADARLVEATLNQLLRWIVDLNEGESAHAPRFELYEQQQVDTAMSERDERLSRAGARFTPQYYQRVYQLQDGDLDLSAAAQPLLAGPAFAEPPEPRPDALDALIGAEMADWQTLLDPVATPLQALLDQALEQGQSAAQLLARLPDVLPALDLDALTAALTRAAFTARLAGLAGLEPDAELAAERAERGDSATAAAFGEPAAPPPPPPPHIELHLHPVIQAAIQLPEAAAPGPAPAPVIHNHIQLPVPPAPVVHNTIALPEPAAPSVTIHPLLQPAAPDPQDQARLQGILDQFGPAAGSDHGAA